MLNRMKRVAAGLLTAVFLFNIAPVSGVNNVAQVEAAKLVTKGKVNSSILNIRTRKSTKAKKITTLKRGAKVTLLSNNSKWVAVKVKGKVGYTQGKYITIANGATASATTMRTFWYRRGIYYKSDCTAYERFWFHAVSSECIYFKSWLRKP